MEFDKRIEKLYREMGTMSKEEIKKLDLSDKVKLMQYGTHLNKKNVNIIYESVWIMGLGQDKKLPEFYRLLSEDELTKSRYINYKMEELKRTFQIK